MSELLTHTVTHITSWASCDAKNLILVQDSWFGRNILADKYQCRFSKHLSCLQLQSEMVLDKRMVACRYSYYKHGQETQYLTTDLAHPWQTSGQLHQKACGGGGGGQNGVCQQNRPTGALLDHMTRLSTEDLCIWVCEKVSSSFETL